MDEPRKEPEQVEPNESLPGPPDGIEVKPNQARPASPESRADAERILRHNRELLANHEQPSGDSEADIGTGRTVKSDPSSGVSRGDYSND